MTMLVACSAPPTDLTQAPPTPARGSIPAIAGASGPADGQVPIQPEAWAADRAAAATELVRTRASAVGTGDLATWLTRVEGAALRITEEQVFRRLRSLPVERVALRSVAETVPPIPAEAGRRVTWDVRATLEYRFKGFDTSARTFTLDLTLTADPSRSRQTTALTASRPGDRPVPWDYEGMRVHRSRSALVITYDGGPTYDDVVRGAALAAQQVDAVLGEAVPAVWVAPPTSADAAALLGRTAMELAGVAAAVDGPIGPGRPAGADRIVLVPDAWRALTTTGREVVMAHELTHAVTRRTSLRQPPLWLSEGLAEFVAYRPVNRPERELVTAALQRVRDRGLPMDLPSSAEFEAAGPARAQAYALALLVARTIAERHGTDGLVSLFMAANGSSPVATGSLGEGDAMVDHLLKDLLGTSRAAVVSAWRARLAALERGR